MPKLLFIEPKPPNLHIFSNYPIPRLGNIMLATKARQRDWNAEVIVEELSGFDIHRPPKADLVGISSITSTALRAYEIAEIYRRKGVPVLMGGPHISFMPDEAIRHTDFVIRGEGEVPFASFLDAFERGDGWEKVPGLSFRKGERIIHNPSPAEPTDLAGLPIPDFSTIRSFKNRYKRMVIPVETSRGCPYNCEFCSVAQMFGRRMRFRPIEETVEELKLNAPLGRTVFFVDDNFAAHPERTKKLLQAIVDSGMRLRWSAQVRSDSSKDKELLDLMRRSGCFAVYIGIESINPDTLVRVKKMQTAEGVREAIERFHQHKIKVHGMFILGFDEDSKKSVRQTWRYALRNMLNSVQFLILTPLPGTRLFQKLWDEKRIISKNWSLYDAHHVVFKPRKLLPIDLQKLQMKAHEKFYSLFQQIRHLLRFNFFELLIADYANRINRQWKAMNRYFVRRLKDISKKIYLK